MEKDRKCKYCGKDISHKNKQAIYCNRSCKDKFNVKKKRTKEFILKSIELNNNLLYIEKIKRCIEGDNKI